jgi:hypothetical protein
VHGAYDGHRHGHKGLLLLLLLPLPLPLQKKKKIVILEDALYSIYINKRTRCN